MKSLCFIFVILVTTVGTPNILSNQSVVAADEDMQDDDFVQHFTEKSLPKYLEDHNNVLIMFYAPWCHHCKSFKPEFIEVAKELTSEGMNTTLGFVDCTVEMTIAQNYKISGYPTMLYFKEKNQPQDYVSYDSDRSKSSLKRWLLKKEKGVVSWVTAAEASELLDDTKIPYLFTHVVAYIKPNSGKAKMYEKRADENSNEENFVFAAVAVLEASQSKVVVAISSQKFKFPGETFNAEYVGKDSVWKSKELKEHFLLSSKRPITAELFPSEIFGKRQTGFIMRVNPGEEQKTVDELHSVLQEYQGKIKFTFVDDSNIEGVTQYLGLRKTGCFAVLLDSSTTDDQSKEPLKHYLDCPLTAASISIFFDDFKNKKLPIFYRSGTPGMHGIFRNLTANTFEDVLQKDKGFLVLYHSKRCRACLSFTQMIEEAYAGFNNRSDLVVCKWIVEENDQRDIGLPDFEDSLVVGYPKGIDSVNQRMVMHPDKTKIKDIVDFIEGLLENYMDDFEEL